MTMKTGQVEAAVGHAMQPQADALPRYTSLRGRRCQRSAPVYRSDRTIDVLHAVDFPRQDIARQGPLAGLARQATDQHHVNLCVVGTQLEAA